MATYCFKCPECGSRSTTVDLEKRICGPCFIGAKSNANLQVVLVRDYQAEGVGFNGLAEMKRQREQGLDGLSGRKEQRDLFLPTAEEMKTPQDPTGQKGIRHWAETHKPKDQNKRPLYPEMEKKVY